MTGFRIVHCETKEREISRSACVTDRAIWISQHLQIDVKGIATSKLCYRNGGLHGGATVSRLLHDMKNDAVRSAQHPKAHPDPIDKCWTMDELHTPRSSLARVEPLPFAYHFPQLPTTHRLKSRTLSNTVNIFHDTLIPHSTLCYYYTILHMASSRKGTLISCMYARLMPCGEIARARPDQTRPWAAALENGICGENGGRTGYVPLW